MKALKNKKEVIEFLKNKKENTNEFIFNGDLMKLEISNSSFKIFYDEDREFYIRIEMENNEVSMGSLI